MTILYVLNNANSCNYCYMTLANILYFAGDANFFSEFRDFNFGFLYRFRAISRISGVHKVRCAYSIELSFQIIVYYNVYLNTPETAEVSHPVYWLFLYGLFMSHAHNPPPRVVDSRPPFQSPGSVRMFCIARRSVAEFFYQ